MAPIGTAAILPGRATARWTAAVLATPVRQAVSSPFSLAWAGHNWRAGMPRED